MTKYLLGLLILLASTGVAVAQPIYGWQDEKGQWVFSDVVPPGISARKILDDIPPPEPLRPTPQTQPNASSSAASKTHEKPIGKLRTAHSSDFLPVTADPRWLLIFPPRTRSKPENSRPFADWRPVRLFESDEACFAYKAALLSGSPDSLPSFSELNSNCIPASEFITGKEADVSVANMQFVPSAAGFSGHLLSGRVFNRGQDTARNVLAKYKIRDRNGVIIAHGEASTSPRDIPGGAFAEFRTPSIGGWSLEGVRAQAEADWVKK